MNCVFVQISTNLINADCPDDIAAKYYRTFWHNKESDGFYKPDHFWEIPVWIAELSYTLPDDWDRELYIVTDISKAIEKLSDDDIDYMFFSCMDSNKGIIEEILGSLSINWPAIIIGGCCKPNVDPYDIGDSDGYWYDSIRRFCETSSIPYKYGTDYKLFENYRTIPRLELSDGCKHNCKFCAVDNKITEKNWCEIENQVELFFPLEYKLVYLNDKTFGQAKNYKWLSSIADYLHWKNPNFQGFIVQTTCNQICKPGFIDFLKVAGVKYVELGIESFNNSILQAMNKPQSESTIHKAALALNRAGIKIIGNIIIGLPGETRETYSLTIRRLQYHKFYSLNINNLALYDNTKLSTEIESDGPGGNEQLQKHKSYHTEADRGAIDWFHNEIYKLGLQIVDCREGIE